MGFSGWVGVVSEPYNTFPIKLLDPEMLNPNPKP